MQITRAVLSVLFDFFEHVGYFVYFHAPNGLFSGLAFLLLMLLLLWTSSAFREADYLGVAKSGATWVGQRFFIDLGFPLQSFGSCVVSFLLVSLSVSSKYIVSFENSVVIDKRLWHHQLFAVRFPILSV